MFARGSWEARSGAAPIGWSARASVGAETNTGDRSAAGNTGTSSVPEVRKLTTSSKSPPSYTPLIQLGSMGIAHAIGRRMTIRVTRSQTNRAVPFISVAILTSRSWVVSTPTPRLRSPFADPGVILTRVWSQSGFSPTVLHGLPHYASGKAAILDGRIILDEDPLWPDGAPAPRTPLLSCAALPSAHWHKSLSARPLTSLERGRHGARRLLDDPMQIGEQIPLLHAGRNFQK